MTTFQLLDFDTKPLLTASDEQTRKDLALIAVLDWLTLTDAPNPNGVLCYRARATMRKRMAAVFPDRFDGDFRVKSEGEETK